MLEDQRSNQLLELGYLSLGAVIVSAGLMALLITMLRRERRDLSLAFFGSLSVLVGIRFLITTSLIRVVLGGSPDLWNKGQVSTNYLLAVAAFAFIRSNIGSGWRSSIQWATLGYFVFAGVALLDMLIFPAREFFVMANNFAMVAVLATIFANVVRPVYRKDRSARIIAACSMAGIMFFLLESLRSLDLVSLNFHTRYVRIMIFHSTVIVIVLVVRYIIVKENRLAVVGQELRTARQIQTSILPRSAPTVPGLEIASRYEPMTEVAGDFYDFTAVGDARLGILVADVSGHGVPAALIASMVKIAFLAQVDQAHEPARVLDGLNRILSGQLESQFVTAGYAFIDLDAGLLRYSGAAHPPLLICPVGGGDIVSLENNGLMLGPFPEATYKPANRNLTPGDRVVMYTDGLTEAENSEDEQYGDERLRRFLAGQTEYTAEELADNLMKDVASWSGKIRSDDLTFVVIDIVMSDNQID